MQEFKVGDRLVSVTNNASNFPKGSIAIFKKYDSAYTGNPEDCIRVCAEGNSYDYGLYAYKFELSQKLDSKTPKAKDELFAIFNESCNNFIGSAKSFQEAVDKANPSGTETLTIFQLFPVAKSTRRKVIERIKISTDKAKAK